MQSHSIIHDSSYLIVSEVPGQGPIVLDRKLIRSPKRPQDGRVLARSFGLTQLNRPRHEAHQHKRKHTV